MAKVLMNYETVYIGQQYVIWRLDNLIPVSNDPINLGVGPILECFLIVTGVSWKRTDWIL